MMFHVTMEKAEDGWIVAECPALPGCVSQGRDEQEALENIREAITGWMWSEDQKALKQIPEIQRSSWRTRAGLGTKVFMSLRNPASTIPRASNDPPS
jgi:predicted RNase H-like HicB family nuclease